METLKCLIDKYFTFNAASCLFINTFPIGKFCVRTFGMLLFSQNTRVALEAEHNFSLLK